MGRLMPGRIRQEGIDLYDRGQLQVEKVEDRRLYLKIGEATFCYAIEDEALDCSCPLFGQKGYCQHLAATEYFLKNDAKGIELVQTLQDEGAIHQEVTRRTYFGGLFLDDLLSPDTAAGLRYQLSVEGQLLPFDSNIDWTLKIRRLPDDRSYIIRDIGAFLKLVKKSEYYQIGKNYYEVVNFDNFDAASQELLEFLFRLVPEKPSLDSDVLPHFGRHLRLPLAYFEEGLDLFKELHSFQVSYDMQTYKDLILQPLTAEVGLFEFHVRVDTRVIELVIEEVPCRSLFNGRYFLKDHNLYVVDRRQERLLEVIGELVPTESGLKKVQVDFQDQDRLAASLLDLQTIGKVTAPKRFLIEDFKPRFRFSLTEAGDLSLALSLEFSRARVEKKEDLAYLPFALHYRHLEAVYHLMKEVGFAGDFKATRSGLHQADWYAFFTQDLPRFRSMGQVELAPEVENLFVTASPHLSVASQGSLLDISFDFQGIDSEEISLALQALLNEESYYTSQSGRIFVFDEDSMRISRTLLDLRARFNQEGQLSLDRFASFQLNQALAGEKSVSYSEDFQRLAYDLAHPEEFSLPPLTVQTDLRDYQLQGIRWLSMLDYYGFGGILADDMGLGKTLQSLAFLSGRLDSKSRVLILAPSSLIYNWQEECKKFTPHLDMAVVYGSKEKRTSIIQEDHQILVTSYPSFRQDAELYRSKHYDYLILDEAQVMKNAQTKIAQQLREFEVGACFALSGTPIENHLAELWSIFQIVLPGLLPSKNDFAKLSAQEVARIIKPFVLRRRKEEVLLELPDLIEVNVLNELTDEQKAIYLAQLQQMQTSVLGASDAEINRKKIEILSGITRLRQICDTPSLFMDAYQGQSGKLESLRELLNQLKEGGHRVLIFSQFRTMLDLIEQDVAAAGLTSYKLTGSTPTNARQEMTQAFNAGSRDAFLISLKAGGVGLNLTGADTVILVDLWWNPAVEAQAISRAHRMGQTEKVECYRLITRGTIEEKIQSLQESKKNLVTTVLDGNESRASMTVQEIREILGIAQPTVN
ncbi:DEAD/DEAH box helicase [Streptococcus oriscaviae]|uniref:SNF2 helicase associated domain-containing protein n=1 Tax=Streptococcus oriscaviae TaxID=2781599 RepID=A0ABX7YKW8_9STRE|nr:DEAD/DEAH box helicase [Streptococcus oriscaviae]QUE54107.1 SNF2 helicase associated domain-containing protein [Streptococcus oriscaviae]